MIREDKRRLLRSPPAAEEAQGAQAEHAERGRLGDCADAGEARDTAADVERRALRLDVVVDDAVVTTIDHAVVIEVAVRVPGGAGDLNVVVDQAVICLLYTSDAADE